MPAGSAIKTAAKGSGIAGLGAGVAVVLMTLLPPSKPAEVPSLALQASSAPRSGASEAERSKPDAQAKELPPAPPIVPNPRFADLQTAIAEIKSTLAQHETTQRDLANAITALLSVPPAATPPPAVKDPPPVESAEQLNQRWAAAVQAAMAQHATLVIWVAKAPCIDPPPAGTVFFTCRQYTDSTGTITTPSVIVLKPALVNGQWVTVRRAVLNDPGCAQVMQEIQRSLKAASAPQGWTPDMSARPQACPPGQLQT